ncbi:MAG: hypothetical protein GX801_10940 [Fibrobacter sp.]|nr:hypothetical protein [Fibrobacter sp.]
MKNKILICSLALFVTSYSQNINLTGLVTDVSNAPITNAKVSLAKKPYQTTTDKAGRFTLEYSVPVTKIQIKQNSLHFGNNTLKIQMAAPSKVSIKLYNTKGNQLFAHSYKGKTSSLTHPLHNHLTSNGVYILNVNINSTPLFYQIVKLNNQSTQLHPISNPGVHKSYALQKISPFNDTLIVSAEGYNTSKLSLNSYEEYLHIKLQPSSDAVPTRGCGKDLGVLKEGNNSLKLMSNNMQREYTINIPKNYNKNHPHNLIFTWHWINARDADVVNGNTANGGANWSYYGLKRMADSAGVPTIFIAPQSRHGRWDEVDHILFDDLLSKYKNDLCIDSTRVFATGFSFGAMQTYSLSLSKQKDLRAVATIAAANWNIYLPQNTHLPIAYLGITGMSDDLCSFVRNHATKEGGYYAAVTHATDNGCEIPNNIPTAAVGSKSHVIYDFKNCPKNYPVRYITFDGGHIAAPTDGQHSDDGNATWVPRETWKFFSQF